MPFWKGKNNTGNMSEEEEKIKKLLEQEWKNFKEIMKDHELEKDILEKMYIQENTLHGALNMADSMIKRGELKAAEGYLRQAETHHEILDRFELMFRDLEEKDLSIDKKRIKDALSRRDFSATIKKKIGDLRREIEKLQKKAA